LTFKLLLGCSECLLGLVCGASFAMWLIVCS